MGNPEFTFTPLSVYMLALDRSDVQLNFIVIEFLYVEIKNPSVADAVFEYIITDTENQVLRKGHFTGLYTQLRLSHLKNGKYFFGINIKEQGPILFEFIKKSPEDSEDMTIRTY